MKKLLLSFSLLAACCTLASAQIGIQFADGAAETGPDYFGDNFLQYTDHAASNTELSTTPGTLGYGLYLTIGGGVGNSVQTGSTTTVSDKTATPDALFAGLQYAQDLFANDGSVSAVASRDYTLTGLTPNTEYDLAVYAGSSTGGTDTTFISGDAAGTASGSAYLDENGRDSYEVASAMKLGNTIVDEFNSGDAGSVTFTATAGPSTYLVVNGFSVIAAADVPEPSTWALIGMSGLVLLALRRRFVRS